MEAQHFQEGDLMDHTPSGAMTGGEVINLAGEAVFAMTDIAASAKGAVRRKGIAKVACDNTVGNVGDPVWWDTDGDPVGGTAGTGACTQTPSLGDFPMGSLAVETEAAHNHSYIRMNDYAMDPRVWPGKVHETKSDDYTLDAADNGKVIAMDTDAKAFTLPATVVGYEFILTNGGDDGEVLLKVSPNSSDKIMGPDTAGTNNKAQQNTKATAIKGDYIHLLGDGADGWFINARRGTWAEES